MKEIEQLVKEAEEKVKTLSSQPISIEAKDVVPGDYIYNSFGYCQAVKWEKVTEVILESATNVKISTAIFYTVKHPREGIVVKRAQKTEEK